MMKFGGNGGGKKKKLSSSNNTMKKMNAVDDASLISMPKLKGDTDKSYMSKINAVDDTPLVDYGMDKMDKMGYDNMAFKNKDVDKLKKIYK